MNIIGKRIIIIGSPGSGKSTFSRKLAEITGIPLIHLDKEYWSSGWVETPNDEWARKHENLLLGEEWIIDGNYGSTMDKRIDRADTIICFELSRVTCVLRYFKRVFTNINRIRPDMSEGCPEHFDFEFMKYIWNFPKTKGKRNFKKLQGHKDKHIIVFKKRNDANKYIHYLANKSVY